MIQSPLLLLADDDADDRDMFADALQGLYPEAKLISLKDGVGVITYLEQIQEASIPSAIILDYNMPNMNGAQVLDRLCTMPEYDGIGKFVWSTAAQKEFVDSCKKKGALEYFVKPNNEKGLNAIIEKIMSIISSGNTK